MLQRDEESQKKIPNLIDYNIYFVLPNFFQDDYR